MYQYGHGGNAAYESGKAHMLDLSANINPLGPPKGVGEAILRSIPDCARYPDSSSRALREKLAAFEGTEPGRIFCGNGASDVIFRLPKAVGARKILVTAPTFSDYERSAGSWGAEVLRYPLPAANGFALDGGFAQMAREERPDLVYVCNPNNPTGALAGAGLLEELLACCRDVGAWVAVDECFLDFAGKAGEHTCKAFLGTYANLVVVKAFTKLFALPGIRLGYAICADEGLIGRLYLHGADWPVSTLAQAAGMAALEGAAAYIGQSVDYVARERGRMERALARLGYTVFPSCANYVFLQSPFPFCLRDALDEEGIRIRLCGNYHGLDGSYCRIAVSTAEDNDRLIGAVGKVTEAFSTR